MSKVRFEITAPEAERVFLVGDFNQWDASARRLTRTSNGEGRFVALMDLPPGRYEYKFVVDGAWACCPHAPRVPNCHGSENCIVDVVPNDKGLKSGTN